MIVPLAPPPLVPDGDEGRAWARRELADPIYREAEPTGFDRAARAVGDFFASLFQGTPPDAFGPWSAVIVAAVVLVLIVLAFWIWGRPRAVARSHAAPELFGEVETRSADELRRAADARADRAQWEEAIVLRMRALARALAERTVVAPEPGATVHRFARTAAAAFPAEAVALERAADAFDDVRYLRRRGTAEAYRAVADLDARIAASVPVFDQVVPA
ncbi:DUF4129 domain-containing protein [Microbacterium sp.]|uniref:DUF4129 domain-containing protein n=1 Tax=Microbacterium sp. TaxID=51671 RepID=UPI0039E24CBB